MDKAGDLKAYDHLSRKKEEKHREIAKLDLNHNSDVFDFLFGKITKYLKHEFDRSKKNFMGWLNSSIIKMRHKLITERHSSALGLFYPNENHGRKPDLHVYYLLSQLLKGDNFESIQCSKLEVQPNSSCKELESKALQNFERKSPERCTEVLVMHDKDEMRRFLKLFKIIDKRSKTMAFDMLVYIWATSRSEESTDDNIFFQAIVSGGYDCVLWVAKELRLFETSMRLHREPDIPIFLYSRLTELELSLESYLRTSPNHKQTLLPSDSAPDHRIVFIDMIPNVSYSFNDVVDTAVKSEFLSTSKFVYIVVKCHNHGTNFDGRIENEKDVSDKRVSLNSYVMYFIDGQIQHKDYIEVKLDGSRNDASENMLVLLLGDFKRNAAHFAATKGQCQILKVLIDEVGIPLSINSSNQLSILHLAVMYGQEDIVKIVCQREPTLIEHTDIIGRTPLHIAAQRNLMSILKILIEYDADVYSLAGDSSTVLHMAASHKVHHMLDFLCKQFDFNRLNTVNKIGLKPIHFAARHSPKSIQVLIDNGETFDVKTNSGSTIAHIGAYHGQKAVLQYIANHLKDLFSITDKIGRSPAHWASKEGQVSCLEFLIECKNSCIFTKCFMGEMVVHTAARHGQLDVIKFLGANYAHVFRERDGDENTVGHITARYGHLECLKFVCESNLIDPAAKDNKGCTILDLSHVRGDAAMEQWICEKYPGMKNML